MGRRVAVIGAGASGLTAVKSCLDEGLETTCFELSKDIGGVWRFTEEVEDGRASIYPSVVTNTSKEMTCYSDFPFPENFPPYLHHTKVLEYLRLYAEQFDLLRYIRFKTKVCSIRRSQDFEKSGQWEVATETEGLQESTIFDAVMICAGLNNQVHLPLESIPGIERYKGLYCHSREYKSPGMYQGKRVLVVGLGNSGVDIASEISHVAAKVYSNFLTLQVTRARWTADVFRFLCSYSLTSQVFVSTRSGSWVLKRVSDGGYPFDMVLFNRFQQWVRKQILPTTVAFWIIEKKLSQWFNHANYGLLPQNRNIVREPIVNDYLPSDILSGAVTVKPSVAELGETWASFEDSTREEIDAVIFATGYRISFPFLQEKDLQEEVSQLALYRNIFPTSLKKPTLVFIGLIRLPGSIFPTSEMQSRWATRVFKGIVSLPSANSMITYTNIVREQRAKCFGSDKNQAQQADFIAYLDEVAADIGVKPSLSLFIKDFELAKEIFFGPCTSYQYRLNGPGTWTGARHAILTQWERTIKPTRTRVVHEPSKVFNSWHHLMALGLLALTLAVFFSDKYFKSLI